MGVYVGGCTSGDENALRRAFNPFGRIMEVRYFKDKGYAFVRYDNKESACNAIVALHCTDVGGQNVKCSWGKEGGGGPPVPGQGLPEGEGGPPGGFNSFQNQARPAGPPEHPPQHFDEGFQQHQQHQQQQYMHYMQQQQAQYHPGYAMQYYGQQPPFGGPPVFPPQGGHHPPPPMYQPQQGYPGGEQTAE